MMLSFGTKCSTGPVTLNITPRAWPLRWMAQAISGLFCAEGLQRAQLRLYASAWDSESVGVLLVSKEPLEENRKLLSRIAPS